MGGRHHPQLTFTTTWTCMDICQLHGTNLYSLDRPPLLTSVILPLGRKLLQQVLQFNRFWLRSSIEWIAGFMPSAASGRMG